jgi:hypothetical protein
LNDDASPDGRRETSNPIRVLVVDDHRAFADSLQLAISLESDLECPFAGHVRQLMSRSISDT